MRHTHHITETTSLSAECQTRKMLIFLGQRNAALATTPAKTTNFSYYSWCISCSSGNSGTMSMVACAPTKCDETNDALISMEENEHPRQDWNFIRLIDYDWNVSVGFSQMIKHNRFFLDFFLFIKLPRKKDKEKLNEFTKCKIRKFSENCTREIWK